jgi:hypothetical protein
VSFNPENAHGTVEVDPGNPLNFKRLATGVIIADCTDANYGQLWLAHRSLCQSEPDVEVPSALWYVRAYSNDPLRPPKRLAMIVHGKTAANNDEITAALRAEDIQAVETSEVYHRSSYNGGLRLSPDQTATLLAGTPSIEGMQALLRPVEPATRTDYALVA